VTPVRAIRSYCGGGNKAEVRRCPIADCPLFPFRLGRNPNCRPRTGKTTFPPHTVAKPVGSSGVPAKDRAFRPLGPDGNSGSNPVTPAIEQKRRRRCQRPPAVHKRIGAYY